MSNPSDAEVTRSYSVDARNDAFIEQRASRLSVRNANARRRQWAESEKQYREDLQAQRGEQWRLFYERQARVHEHLAAEARQRAKQLNGGRE